MDLWIYQAKPVNFKPHVPRREGGPPNGGRWWTMGRSSCKVAMKGSIYWIYVYSIQYNSRTSRFTFPQYISLLFCWLESTVFQEINSSGRNIIEMKQLHMNLHLVYLKANYKHPKIGIFQWIIRSYVLIWLEFDTAGFKCRSRHVTAEDEQAWRIWECFSEKMMFPKVFMWWRCQLFSKKKYDSEVDDLIYCGLGCWHVFCGGKTVWGNDDYFHRNWTNHYQLDQHKALQLQNSSRSIRIPFMFCSNVVL